MAELILDGESTYDVASIEADRFFDLPGYTTRTDITRKCVEMAGGYYGRVENPAETSQD